MSKKINVEQLKPRTLQVQTMTGAVIVQSFIDCLIAELTVADDNRALLTKNNSDLQKTISLF